jgi:adenylate kinase
MNIILLGPPGVGKTTHAHFLSKKLHLPIILTSNLLISKSAQINFQTKMVPDTIVNRIILKEILNTRYNQGFILEGYPRTVCQASMLCKRFLNPCHVFILKAPKNLLVKRILGRTVCPNCTRVYVEFDTPPKTNGICDDCRCNLIKRDDDKIGEVEERIEVELSNLDQIKQVLETYFVVAVVDSNDNLTVISKQLIEKVIELKQNIFNKNDLLK